MFRTNAGTTWPAGLDLDDQPVYLYQSQSNDINVSVFQRSSPLISKIDSTFFKVNYYTHVFFIQFSYIDIYNVGLNEKENEIVKIFPNPASSTINVFLETPYNYSVTSNKGNILLKGIVDIKKSSIVLTNFNIGTYFIQLQNGKNIITKKIIL